ncbi:MAG: FadR/GntR family transcriptional regulator [Leifsonia sp.]
MAAPKDAEKVTTRSQTEVVVQDIKAMILRGELGPGARLPIESELAVALGVSRSSLREGVRALAVMGVLETRQGDGTYVTSLQPSLLMSPMEFIVDLQQGNQVEHISAVRRVLEVEAAGRAALHISRAQLDEAEQVLDSMAELIARSGGQDHKNIMDADIAFHRLIAKASQNPALEALIEALSSRTVRTRMWRSISEGGATSNTERQHAAILQAVASGDPDRARLMMSIHLLGVEEFAATHPEEDDQEVSAAPFDKPHEAGKSAGRGRTQGAVAARR